MRRDPETRRREQVTRGPRARRGEGGSGRARSPARDPTERWGPRLRGAPTSSADRGASWKWRGAHLQAPGSGVRSLGTPSHSLL